MPTETLETTASQGRRSAELEARLQEMKRSQGVIESTFDEMLGFGKDCFDSDEDFEDFLRIIRKTRTEPG